MRLELAEIARAIGAAPAAAATTEAAGYGIDSRTLRAGEVFFAVAGERLDGHDFVGAALAKGAAAAVVAGRELGRYSAAERERLLAVGDPLAALQTLATAVRQRWGGLGGGRRLAAVTGSAGKTTTKDMTAAVLEVRGPVLKTLGNLNNQFGLPLTLLRLEAAHLAAVVEMGMNHAGEISRLAAIALPDVGVFTNVGEAHLGNFHSIAELAEAKRELARAVPASGVLVLNADDARVAAFGECFAGRCRFYGAGAGKDGLRVEQVSTRGAEGSQFLAVARPGDGGGKALVRIQFPGRGHVSNAAAALATGLEFGVGLEAGAEALGALAPGRGRGARLQAGGMQIIDDCYNANPAAMEQMLEVLAETPGERRVAVLGEMRELGAEAPALHSRVGRRVNALARAGRIDALFTVEGEARSMDDAARAGGALRLGGFSADAIECGRRLRDFLRPGDVVLFKASRGVGLERAMQAVLEGRSDSNEARQGDPR